MMDEDHDTRLRRLRMRSWRRGMKEMDLILGPFADDELRHLSADLLDLYEDVMAENDQDLYLWITARSRGQTAGPEYLAPILDVISKAALSRLKPRV